MDLSVIIPVYKGNRYLRKLCDMLESNMLYNDFYTRKSVEVVFVNDYPEESIIIPDENFHFSIKIIVNMTNVGIHGSRANGIKYSSSDYIIMLDQDDCVKPEWMFELCKAVDASGRFMSVCYGWNDRFRMINTEKEFFLEHVNDVCTYIQDRNVIRSPGQVLIKRDVIPNEWLENIQKINGSDDILLWIMLLKSGNQFEVVDKPLYFHTPDRTSDSIDCNQMLLSLHETRNILKRNGFINEDENRLFNLRLEKSESNHKVSNKFRRMFLILFKWTCLRNEGFSMARKILDMGFKSIAIHGMGYLGQCLYTELKNSSVDIVCGIDRNAEDFAGELKIYTVENLPENFNPDLIITTVTGDEKIVETLESQGLKNVRDLNSLLQP